ncbi:putative sulfate/molybdate transporter [Salinirarus marinus]|uniref:putative sulfate/molybdate transporter n=1 Tax=Salinirarus marinus TaxID=3068310 RepID=UPI003C6C095A
MAGTFEARVRRGVEISSGEVTGAIGDSITVLPVVVALGALTPLSVPHVLLWFGVFQILWGVVYGLPLSVEPMKALAGLAIAGALSYGELVAAGLLAGAVLLLAGRTDALAHVERFVGDSVVRGVQLAVALVLAQAGVDLALADPALAVGAGVAAVAFVAVGRAGTGALAVLGAGLALGVGAAGLPTPTLPGVPPVTPPALTANALSGAAAQLAMTVGNAAVATSLLCADLFDAEVQPDELATSMGAMTLLSVPLGGLPMCHGSGGLAGKYAFGARTGGANVVLGVGYLLAALVAGVVVAFPTAALGVLLLLVAVQLAESARQTSSLPVTVGVGVIGLLVNVGTAFVLGASVHWYLDRRAA